MVGMLKINWLFSLLPRAIRNFSDARVPFYYKWLPFIGLLTFLSPVTRLLAAYPLLGLLDGFAFTLIGLALFNWLADRYLQKIAARQPQAKAEEFDWSRPLKTVEGEFTLLEETIVPSSQPIGDKPLTAVVTIRSIKKDKPTVKAA